MSSKEISIDWPLLTIGAEWEQHQKNHKSFQYNRRIIDSALIALCERPTDALIQQATTCISSASAHLPLQEEERERMTFWAQKRRKATALNDITAASIALTGFALYAPLTRLETIQGKELAPWLPPIIGAALGLRLVSFDSKEEERLMAMNWSLSLAREIINAHNNNTLPGGNAVWMSWVHALAFSSPFVPFHSSSFNIEPFAALFGKLRREAYDHLKPPEQINFNIHGVIQNKEQNSGRLRIGLLTTAPQMHAHGLPDFIWWITLLDRTLFEPILILGGDPSQNLQLHQFLTQHLAALTRYAPVVVVGEGAYKKLKALELDLLYNFCGFPWGNGDRMGHIRLAQKHVTAFYTPATTGCTEIDIYLSSQSLDPDPTGAFTEDLALLDGLPFCFHYASYFNGMPCQGARPKEIPPNAIIYALGSAVTKKLTRTFMGALIAILKRVPNSVILMMPSLTIERRPHLISFLVNETTKAGINPNRFYIYPQCKRAELYALLAASDVFLDFFPFSGTNNIIDPISVNLPPVVLLPPNGYSRNRIGGIIMQELQLHDLVANDVDHYIDTAVDLGIDSQKRLLARVRLGRDFLKKSPLFDGPTFIERIQKTLFLIAGKNLPDLSSMAILKREEIEEQINDDFASFVSDQKS